MVRWTGDIERERPQRPSWGVARAAMTARQAAARAQATTPTQLQSETKHAPADASDLLAGRVPRAPDQSDGPKHTGPGPCAAQLRALAEDPDLRQVLLPAPRAVAPDAAEVGRLLAHIESFRASGRGAPAKPPAQPGPETPDRESPPAPPAARLFVAGPASTSAPDHRPVAGQLDALLRRAFSAADLPQLRRCLGLSPRADRELASLLGPRAQTTDVAEAGKATPADTRDAEGAHGPPRGSYTPPASATHAAKRVLGAAAGRATDALHFSLRGHGSTTPRQGVAAPSVAVRSTKAPLFSASYVGWSAFAAKLSSHQQQSLFRLLLSRMRDVTLQNQAEADAQTLDFTRSRRQVRLERPLQTTRLAGEVLSLQSDWRSSQVSALRNTQRPLAREAGVYEQSDGTEASRLRAQQRRLLRAAAARAPAGVGPTPGAAEALLSWVPAADGRPARRLRRLVLEPEELATLSAAEQNAWHQLDDQLRTSDRQDLAAVFGRLATSAAQLTQAAERCDSAADAAQAAGEDPGPLRALGAGYAGRAEAQRLRAHGCGYLERALAVGRRQKGELAQSMREEAGRRQAAEAERARIDDTLGENNLDAARHAELTERRDALVVELEDRNLRLAGMHLAIRATDALRAGHEAGRPEGGQLRRLWGALRPQNAGVPEGPALLDAHFDDLLRPRHVPLLSDDELHEHLHELGSDAVAWAEGYADPAFGRLDAMNTVWSPLVQQFVSPAHQMLARQSEGGLTDLAGYFAGDRDAYYAAIEREQGQTEALIAQLRSLWRAST